MRLRRERDVMAGGGLRLPGWLGPALFVAGLFLWLLGEPVVD